MLDQHRISDPSATRTEGLRRLQSFVPKAGRDYAARRNYDLPDAGHPHVSQLSPYVRHRLVSEEEVVRTILGRHSATASEKFIQEVFWRTYWKGWLEQRPSVWGAYRRDLDRVVAQARQDANLAAAIQRAEAGDTDIEAFNEWATELKRTGYLHNHARMWFASIWIFTLNLPWEAGADFFMRHLLDGDAASNTLSWRWVAGLQTQGKHYLARSSNISKYTEGRHNPEWRLNTQASPLKGPSPPDRRPLPAAAHPSRGLCTGLLITEDDLSPGFVLDLVNDDVVSAAALLSHGQRSPASVSDRVTTFTTSAATDCLSRHAARVGTVGPITTKIEDIVTWVQENGIEQIVLPYAPVGPAASHLRKLRREVEAFGASLVPVFRPWDARAWPYATHGFFKFKARIPDLINAM